MASFTTADRTRLHYVDEGRGEPALVFVHGWCSSLDTWAAQRPRFAPRHRLVTLDRRGHGRSDASAAGYSVREHADDLAELLDHCGVAAALIVAHAGGAPAVLQLAVNRPDLVAGVAAIDARLGPVASDASRSGLLGLVGALRGDDGPAVLERTYRSFFTTSAGDAAVAGATAMPIEIAADELESLAVDSEALARAVTQPVWWISALPIDREALRTSFTTVRVVELSSTGHFPQVEDAEAVNDALADAVAVLRG